MKTIKAIIILTLVGIFTTTTYAAEVPRESAPRILQRGRGTNADCHSRFN